MTPSDAVAALAAAYRQDLTPDTVGIYAKALQDIDPDLLGEAMLQAIVTSKFFPSIAEIRRTAARMAGLLPPSPGEVMALIRRADVREAVYRRDGSYAYTERYWRWPEGTPPETVRLCEMVVAKAGEPCDRDGNDVFGWETSARKVYEAELPALESASLANLAGAKMLTGTRRALP